MHGPLAERLKGSSVERVRNVLLDPAVSVAHYAAAVGAVVLLVLLAWGLHPWFQGRASFLIFIPGILVAAGFW